MTYTFAEVILSFIVPVFVPVAILFFALGLVLGERGLRSQNKFMKEEQYRYYFLWRVAEICLDRIRKVSESVPTLGSPYRGSAEELHLVLLEIDDILKADTSHNPFAGPETIPKSMFNLPGVLYLGRFTSLEDVQAYISLWNEDRSIHSKSTDHLMIVKDQQRSGVFWHVVVEIERGSEKYGFKEGIEELKKRVSKFGITVEECRHGAISFGRHPDQ